MYLGALAEVAVLITLLLSIGSIRSSTRAAVIHAVGPHAAPAATRQLLASVASTVSLMIVIDVVFAVFAIAVWLFFAWANGKGSALARVGAIIACAIYAAFTIAGYAQGDASYAPVAAIVASSAVLVIGIAAVILLLVKQSWPYYTRPATAR
jgi:hypothetical protein